MSDDNAELIAEATGVAAFQGYGSAKGIEVFKKMLVALAAAQPSPVQGTDDEKEALARVIFHAQNPDVDVEYFFRELDVRKCYSLADAILAAGFHR